MIQLPNGFADNIASSSTQFIAQISPMVTLIIGVLLASLAVGLLIRLFTR